MIENYREEEVLSLIACKESPSIHQLEDFENILRTFPAVEAPITHHFAEGIYAREMFIPKGTVLTGKIHKYENLNIMISGELTVSTDKGMMRIKAPFIVVSPPGTKRVAYAHEDTRWITFHPTRERDLEKIEQHFIAQSGVEYIDFIEGQKNIEGGALCLGAL